MIRSTLSGRGSTSVCVLFCFFASAVQEVTHYLVKWCSLSYEESTWELQEDVDPVKIREFEDLKKIPEHKHVVSFSRFIQLN